MHKSPWLWLPLLGAIVYLAGQLRAPDSHTRVAFEIHPPAKLDAPALDAPALSEMLYTKSPELRGQVLITESEAPNRFEIASNDHALVDTAADSLQGLITDHFRARLSSQLDALKTDIEAQQVKVEESRRRMLEILAKEQAGDGEGEEELDPGRAKSSTSFP